MDDDDHNEEVGKGKPPSASQFKPGQSGNPSGRPRGKRSKNPEEIVLDQMVAVRENGVDRMMRADQAFLLFLTSEGLALGGPIARAAMEALEQLPSRSKQDERTTVIFLVYPEPGDVRHATRNLQMATLMDPHRPSAHIRLETWMVEAALARLGERRLTKEEQEIVVAATRMPHKVRWPDWWTV
jgi:hypothetical protein